MSEEPTIASIDDIYHDLESTNRARDRLADFFARGPEAVRDRDFGSGSRSPFQASASPGVGHNLITRCPAGTRRRYGTLLYFEEKARQQEDYSILIAAACQIVEAELDRLLTVPAFAIADGLASALRQQAKNRKQAEILDRWAAKEVPTTIGIQVTVLLALRRSCEQGVLPVVEFLAAHFLPRYIDLLTSKKLAACLDTIRSEFRNPACHGTAAFDEQGYENFVRLVLAQRRFAAWDAFGPTPAAPGAEVGVFHHHLSLSRRLGTQAAADEAATTPLAITDPAKPTPGDAEELQPMPMQVLAEQLREQIRESKCPVRLRVTVATAPGPRQPFTQVVECENRGEGAAQVVEAATGQLIRYEVTTDTEGYLTVLNFGAEGKVEMFLPQDPRTIHRIVPGQAAKLITVLAPPVGKEHTAVIWTRQPSRLSGEEWHERLAAAGERRQVLVLAGSDGAADWTAVVVPVVQRAGDR